MFMPNAQKELFGNEKKHMVKYVKMIKKRKFIPIAQTKQYMKNKENKRPCEYVEISDNDDTSKSTKEEIKNHQTFGKIDIVAQAKNVLKSANKFDTSIKEKDLTEYYHLERIPKVSKTKSKTYGEYIDKQLQHEREENQHKNEQFNSSVSIVIDKKSLDIDLDSIPKKKNKKTKKVVIKPKMTKKQLEAKEKAEKSFNPSNVIKPVVDSGSDDEKKKCKPRQKRATKKNPKTKRKSNKIEEDKNQKSLDTMFKETQNSFSFLKPIKDEHAA